MFTVLKVFSRSSAFSHSLRRCSPLIVNNGLIYKLCSAHGIGNANVVMEIRTHSPLRVHIIALKGAKQLYFPALMFLSRMNRSTSKRQSSSSPVAHSKISNPRALCTADIYFVTSIKWSYANSSLSHFPVVRSSTVAEYPRTIRVFYHINHHA